MKRRTYLIVLGFLLIASVLWLLYDHQRSARPQAAQKDAEAASPTPRSTPFSGPLPEVMPVGPYLGPTDPRWPIRRAMRERDRSYEWKTPIEFYGEVVDQDGRPVEGAIADVIWTDVSAKGSSEMQVTSDASGLFSITGIRGKGMTVQVNKVGYYRQISDARSAFEYAGFWEPSYHIPDSANPVIFRLRKMGEGAALMRNGPNLLGLMPGGDPSFFDLERGRKSKGRRDFAVRLTRGEKNGDQKFDWGVTFESVGAGSGLQESKEEFMTEAPESGYQPSWTFSQKADDKNYQRELQTKFFVKTASGQFARIEVWILPEYNDAAAMTLVSYLNLKPGDRNLEFDPSRAVTKP